MEIERVNEHTLKFFITYVDMENRGFGREEIWYNRERGEELFWEMMDEAHLKEEFPLEGPLWIQVQALEKGLEIIVTRAQLSKDGSKLELPITDEKQIDIPVDENIENMLDEQFHKPKQPKRRLPKPKSEKLTFLLGFNDFEDLIQLSHRFHGDDVSTSLHTYEGNYFLYVVFPSGKNDDEQDNLLSVLLEYGFDTPLTIHRVKEYGTRIIEDKAMETLRHHFPLQS